ncbi:hypothetical protein ACFOSC_01905 [Streptantibioticus rubrisoli]|uniref:Lipoprotein n=1 Tax=Streptantibioticus rubrisoli TaxID=1387313 RepID=A0ABT1PL40_9ACTN|nr:hypothetical protein [Streptantibioticus rubrisoli]MCQ4045511.1 hypothetical protein [Streptantibioticus rubrisoli]
MTSPRRLLGAGVVLALALGTAGCGIRATSVPVDAGAAPTRVSCDQPRTASSTARGTVTVDVYLVCSQRVSPVRRVVPDRHSDRLATARTLLAELLRKPDQAEERGGFASEVPGGLSVNGPFPGDPAETLRLNQDPDDLPSYAVGQLVCTFAGTAAGAADRSVVLGGPDRGVPPLRYRCDDALRTRPDAGSTEGTRA